MGLWTCRCGPRPPTPSQVSRVPAGGASSILRPHIWVCGYADAGHSCQRIRGMGAFQFREWERGSHAPQPDALLLSGRIHGLGLSVAATPKVAILTPAAAAAAAAMGPIRAIRYQGSTQAPPVFQTGCIAGACSRAPITDQNHFGPLIFRVRRWFAHRTGRVFFARAWLPQAAHAAGPVGGAPWEDVFTG